MTTKKPVKTAVARSKGSQVKKPAPQAGAVRVAAIQMASGPSVPANLAEAEQLIELAVEAGARLVVLPEFFCIMAMKDSYVVKAREAQGTGPIQAFLSRVANKHHIWLIGGSIPLEASVANKVRNSCTKDVCEIKIGELDSIIKLLTTVHEFLTSKQDFAEAALSLALMRKQSRNLFGQRAQWTDAECDFAEHIRSKFMPNSLAYGETLPASSKPRAIPSEALGSTKSTEEPLETRTTSSACSNWSHECPASDTDEDIVQNSRKLESWDKEPSEDIATN